MYEEEKRILSVCIPTFNRVESLKKSINILINDDCFDLINIIISDNCSNDNTQSYCENLSSCYKNIYYYRQSKNIGADRNFFKVLNYANTTYAWLLGDDDCVVNGTIYKIINELKKDNYSFCHISNKNVDTMIFDYKKKRNFYSFIDLDITFISRMIFNVEAIKKIHSIEPYVGSYFIQSYFVQECIEHAKTKILVLGNIDLNVTSNDHFSYNFANVFIINYKKFIFSLKINYLLKRRIYSNSFFFSSEFIHMLRNKKEFKRPSALVFIKTFTYLKAWIFLYPSLIMPIFFYKWILKIKNKD